MTAAATSDAWTSRPAVEARTADTVQDLVGTESARLQAMMFTATPKDELDSIARFQQLKDQAWAGQLRAIVRLHGRATVAHREFAADEVALAIGAAPTTGGNLLTEALAICELPGLLEALEAGILTERHVKAVMRELTLQTGFPVAARSAVVMMLLAQLTTQTPRELAKLTARLILLVDTDAAAKRRVQATTDRRVSYYTDADGQAVLHARLPEEKIAQIQARLRAELDAAPTTGDTRTRAQRGADLLTELLTSGTLGDAPAAPYSVGVVVPFSTVQGSDLELAELPGYGPILPATARELLAQASSVSQIAVDENGVVLSVTDLKMPANDTTTATDTTDSTEETTDTKTTTDTTNEVPAASIEDAADHADVADYTDVADHAADFAAWTRELALCDELHHVSGHGQDDTLTSEPTSPQDPTDPAVQDEAVQDETVQDEAVQGDARARWTATLLAALAVPPVLKDLSTAAYRIPTRLVRLVEARDRTCVFPGCHRPAEQTDKDHRTPWPVGATSAANLQCLCRHHHRAKQAAFTVVRLPDGTTRWITRAWWFDRTPKGY